MSACSPFRDDIALRAGGDEPSGPESVAVEAHLEVCTPCRELLAELEAQSQFVTHVVASAWAHEGSAVSVAPPVLAKLAVEAHQGRTQLANRSRRPFSDGGLLAFGRAAAIAVVVTAAALLGLHSLVPGDGPVAEGGAAGKGKDAQPVFVRRAAGEAVELTWPGDGREAARGGSAASTYRVMASATPQFREARPVEVAGNTLVASAALPASRYSDRKLTFFRVE